MGRAEHALLFMITPQTHYIFGFRAIPLVASIIIMDRVSKVMGINPYVNKSLLIKTLKRLPYPFHSMV